MVLKRSRLREIASELKTQITATSWARTGGYTHDVKVRAVRVDAQTETIEIDLMESWGKQKGVSMKVRIPFDAVALMNDAMLLSLRSELKTASALASRYESERQRHEAAAERIAEAASELINDNREVLSNIPALLQPGDEVYVTGSEIVERMHGELSAEAKEKA